MSDVQSGERLGVADRAVALVDGDDLAAEDPAVGVEIVDEDLVDRGLVAEVVVDELLDAACSRW